MSFALRTTARCLVVLAGYAAASTGQTPWELAPPAPAGSGDPAMLDRLDEISCNECHADVVTEWSAGAHALAWVDALYQDELEDKRKPEACHGCHVPERLHGERFGERPHPRAADRHFAISCEACHEDADGAMLGPRGAPTDAHATRASASMTGSGSNALCGACHGTNIGPVVGLAQDFERSRAAAEGGSCAGCHLALRAPDTSGRRVRSHDLQTPRDPAFLRRAFALEVRAEPGRTVLVIANRAGHRVPGLLGRDLVLTAEVEDAAGAVLGSSELTLDTRAHLPVDESLELAVEARGPVLHVTGVHHDPLSGLEIPFLDQDLEVAGG